MGLAPLVATSAAFNAINPAVVGSTGHTIVALAWGATISGGGWTLRVDDNATSGWRLYTRTHAGESGTYTFTDTGAGYPVVFISALSGTSETSYGTPVFTTGNDATADTTGASGTGIALFGVLSFGAITTGSQTNSFTQQQYDPGTFAALATKAVTTSTGAVQYTVAASDYRTAIVVMADAGGPTISAQPADQHVAAGSTASFSVTASASGGGTLSYQWKLNGTNVATGSGGTTANYTTAALALTDNLGSYTCDVTETGGTNDGSSTTTAAIAYVGIRQVGTTAAVYGTTSLTPAYVASPRAGDLWVVIVGQKPSSANGGTLTTPAGYDLLTSLTGANDGDTGGYTTSLAADTGNCNAWALAGVATGAETGTLSLTLGTSNAAWAKLYLYRLPPGTAWSKAGVAGKDTSAGSVSITFASDPGVLAGDAIIGAMVIPTDVTTPAQFSAEAFSQTGVTFGTVTEDEEPDTTTGNDMGGFTCSCFATGGPSSAAPVMTATAGGTTTNVRGPGLFVRLRAVLSSAAQLVVQKRAPGFPPNAPKPGIPRLGFGILQPTQPAASAPANDGTGSAALSSFAAAAVGLLTFTGSGSAAVSPVGADASGAATASPAVGGVIPPQPRAVGYPARRPIPGTPQLGTGILATGPAAAPSFSGAGDAALSSFAASAAGLLTFTGSGSAAVSPFAATGSGAETFSGSGSVACYPFGASASGLESFSGTGSCACSPFAAGSSGAEDFTGSGSAACSPFSASGNGAIGTVFTGSGNAALSPFATSGSGLETFSGTGSAACSPFAAASSGAEQFTGSGSAALSPYGASGTGAQGTTFTGSGSAALSPFGASAAGNEVFAGSGTAACSSFGVAAAGAQTFSGAGAAACSPFAAAGDGFTGPIVGEGAVALSPFGAAGAGAETFTGSGLVECSPFGCSGGEGAVATGPISAGFFAFTTTKPFVTCVFDLTS